jgi:hypothetical protein
MKFRVRHEQQPELLEIHDGHGARCWLKLHPEKRIM